MLVFGGFIPFIGCPQGEWNNWYFGVKAGVTFNMGTLQALLNNTIIIGNCNVSISDSAGNFLFMTNHGSTVYDKNFNPMPNGSNLHCSTSSGFPSQPFFCIQSLLDDSLYFIFNVDEIVWPDTMQTCGLRYSILNMRLNNHLGDIEPGYKNIPVPGASRASACITATRAQNNKDIWLAVRLYTTDDQYAVYKITENGLDTIPHLSTSLVHIGTTLESSTIRWLKFSQDGSKFVCLYGLDGEFCQFNKLNGIIIPLFKFRIDPITLPPDHSSAEFSPNGELLYVTCFEGSQHSYLYQFNAMVTDSAQFMQSKVFLGDRLHYKSVLQMGPDWKIYITEMNNDSLGSITQPNVHGTGCNFHWGTVPLLGRNCFYGLPQFLQKYKAYIHFNGHCQGDSVLFSGDIWPPADSLSWNFGDPGSGAANTSNDTTPSHSFTSAGNYIVELFVRHIDLRTDTARITLTILEAPETDLGPDSVICSGDSITYDAGSCTGCTYQWDNLLTGQYNIANSQTYTAYDSGIYVVTVINPNGCNGADTTQLSIVDGVHVMAYPVSMKICSGDTAQVSLQCTFPPCDFTWTALASSPLVTGYSDGTGPVIDQPLHNADTIDQTVTYTILPSSPSCSGVPLDYPVTVHPAPHAWSDPPSLTICSGQEAALSLSSNLDETTFSWSAYGSSVDVTGFSDGTGPLISQVLQNSGEEVGTVTYLVTPVSGIGCVGLVDSVIVTILPVVEATIMPPSTTICSADTTGILLFCNLSGCDFSWTAVASSPLVSGFSGGTGDTIRQILFNNDTTDQHVTYSIVPSISGCGSDTTEYPVLIHPLLPVSVTISASLNPVCSGIPVTFTATPVNGGISPTFQWQVNGTNTGTNSDVFTYNPASGDQVSVILTSSETCPSNNPATSNFIEMNVVEAPAVSLTACFDTITTTHAKPILLRGGIPLGGSYSGTGVTSSTGGTSWTFDPAIAGVGVHEITYRYTNSAGCMDSAKLSILNSQFSILNCGDSLTDVRDNKKYPTIQIGSQCWMAAGLDYGNEIDSDLPQRDNCIPEKYSPPSSFVPRPSFYQWDEVMQYQETENLQGLCPPEWHVPSEADWEILFANWTNNAFAGKPLLYTGFSGFNALLTGVQFFNRLWEFADTATFIWSSTAHGHWKAWAHAMNQYNYSVSYYPSYRINAFSVRCVRD